MARFVELHPKNPQQRLVTKIVEHLRGGAVAAIPTDSAYAIVCAMANKEGLERIRTIRQVGPKHDFTFLCHDFSQLGNLVTVNNSDFRLIKRLTPGPYTFILKGTKEVPRMTLNAKKHTVGVRIPDHVIVQTILAEMGEALLSSSLILPGQDDAMTEGWQVNDAIGDLVDIVVDGPVGTDYTTVIDLLQRTIIREGAGSTEGIDL
ncbi:L-threonylcarbamoyladenylate synthase [Neoactinobaculum massilliense]|uniref:L-threonylcarbamoyladenylate synthase n=1 Tax=Neoactinobaculum massilliense TaxID=2364794 RepID=UPI000F53DE63|nr:L-threonylcarbamoyladenylate synthase [Neoactinobaculum massilliense]